MFWTPLRRWCVDDEGATAAEYAVMLALIIAAVITAIASVGNSTATGWGNNVNKIMSASSAAAS